MRKSTANYMNERDSSGSQTDRFDTANSHSESNNGNARLDALRFSQNREIDASTFEKGINAKRLQLIEKLEISRGDSRDEANDDNEYFDTHIVNGFDDSVRQEGASSEISNIGRYDGFSVWDVKKNQEISKAYRRNWNLKVSKLWQVWRKIFLKIEVGDIILIIRSK